MQAISAPDRQGRRLRGPRHALGVAAAALVPLLVLTACGGDDEPGGGAGGGDVELRLAHSYTEQQPQHRCGAQVIADEVAKADAGLKVEIFPNSQLGPDADRIASVVSGDIDMDIQGASALGAVYEPVSAVDAAYAFDDGEHLQRFFESPESKGLVDGFASKAKVRTLGAWSIGMRQFTANKPIRTPADLQGLRMRFPNSPQFLMNAKALGASATEVAYEELFLALQQGTVDGQENPIVNIKALNLAEVQDYVSLSKHQANSNLVIIGEKWNELSADQQKVLTDAVGKAVDQVSGCVAEDEQKTLDEWKAGGKFDVVEDVDVAAFRTKAEAYLRANLKGEALAVYEAIRKTATG
jgi:tripartite ATP-independent transporter DctP family solute receptor